MSGPVVPSGQRPSARAPHRPILALADMPRAGGATSPREPMPAALLERAVAASLLATERRIRAAGITRMHASFVPADGYEVRIAGERRGAPILYGSGADLAEALADLFRNAEHER